MLERLPPAVLARLSSFLDPESLDTLLELLLEVEMEAEAEEEKEDGEGFQGSLLGSPAPNLLDAAVVAVTPPREPVLGYGDAVLLSAGNADLRICEPTASAGRTLRYAGKTVGPGEMLWREEPLLAVAGTTEEYLFALDTPDSDLVVDRESALEQAAQASGFWRYAEALETHRGSLEREVELFSGSASYDRQGLDQARGHLMRLAARRRVVAACDHCLAACFEASASASSKSWATPCSAGKCLAWYCSPCCRDAAWTSYHRVECELRRNQGARRAVLSGPKADSSRGNRARPLVWRFLCGLLQEWLVGTAVPSGDVDYSDDLMSDSLIAPDRLPAPIPGGVETQTAAASLESHIRQCSFTIGNVCRQYPLGDDERSAIASVFASVVLSEKRSNLLPVEGWYWLGTGFYRLVSATLSNRFAVQTHANDSDIDEPLLVPLADGVATYALARYMNNACFPDSCTVNGSSPFTSATMSFVVSEALTDGLQSGAELTWPYHVEPEANLRREHLLVHYGFVCRCPVCLQEQRSDGF
jgi:hypothetical protein